MNMTDPPYMTISGLLLGLGMSSALPAINGEALFGAVLGAWLVTTTRSHLKVWQSIGSFLLSAGVGYLFTPVTLPLVPFLTGGVAAFICALMVIPISIKVMQWIDNAPITEILRRIRDRG